MVTTQKMPSPNTHTTSRTGFLLRLAGMLALLGGLIGYAVLLRKMQSGMPAAGGAFGTATPLVIAAAIANAGAVVLMVGLAALRDRAAYRIAGIVLAILLITLDMPALDAFTGPGKAKVIALVIGGLFLIVPWLLPRRKKEA